jgi:hypothetical protein
LAIFKMDIAFDRVMMGGHGWMQCDEAVMTAVIG